VSVLHSLLVQVSNKNFCNLGWSPTTLEMDLLNEVVDIAAKYKERCDKTKVSYRCYSESLATDNRNKYDDCYACVGVAFFFLE
jgi:hypothetical protein